jgi:hypothetical protein
MRKQHLPFFFFFLYSSSYYRVGTWLSLVEHSVRDAGVGGSNPLVPTIFFDFRYFTTNFSFLQDHVQFFADCNLPAVSY